MVHTSGIASADRQTVSGLFAGANVTDADLLSRRSARCHAAWNQLRVEQDDVTSGGR